MGVPKGLDPTGVILADKPAGPSSFAIVARVRSRTGAKTGHAGTLDPFATGLLILLSGRATSLQDRFMKLDKRYVTEIDLHGRTTTGDPEGEPLDEHEAPSADELAAALDELRGDVELPIPAASAVKIDGERAYRLHRRGVEVEMPRRVMRIHELQLLGYDDGVARLDLLVGSGHVRPLVGRRARRPLPEPAPHRDRAVRRRRGRRDAGALARGGAAAPRGGARVRIAHAPVQLERRPRAVAIGTFDGVHRGHLSVLRTAVDSGLDPTVITLEPHPRIALGNRVELITTLERRLELLAEAGVAETLVAAFTPEFMRLTPEQFVATYLTSIGAEAVAVGGDFRFGHKRAGTVETLVAAGLQVLEVEEVAGVSSTAIRDAVRAGELAEAAAMLGRPYELDGMVVAGDQRGGTLGYPTANIAMGPGAPVPALRHLCRRRARPPRGRLDRHEPALRRHRAQDRAVPARLRRRPLRQAPRRRALGAAPRRAGLRERGGARRADRAGCRGDPGARRAAELDLGTPSRDEQRLRSVLVLRVARDRPSR